MYAVASRGCIDPVSNYDPQKDYFTTKVELTLGKRAKLTYYNNYIDFQVKLTETEWIKYALVRCGTPDPIGYLNMYK